jgi:hypothetical protein
MSNGSVEVGVAQENGQWGHCFQPALGIIQMRQFHRVSLEVVISERNFILATYNLSHPALNLHIDDSKFPFFI